jgi:S1-C subfamily serine protease
LREGDVVLRVGGHAVEDLRGLAAALAAFNPGQTVEVVFERAGEKRTVRAKLEAR